MEVPYPYNFAFQLIFMLLSACAFSFAGGYFIYQNHTLPGVTCLASLLLSDIMYVTCIASKFCVSKDIQTPVFGTASGAQYLYRFEKMAYVLNSMAAAGAVGAGNMEYFQLASIFTVLSSGLAFFNWRISQVATALVMLGIGVFGIYLKSYYAATGCICCTMTAFGKAFERRGDIVRTRKVSHLKKYFLSTRWSWPDSLILLNCAGQACFVTQMFLAK